MSKHGGEQTRRRPHWPLLGLLLVALFLGHDADRLACRLILTDQTNGP